jgi:hypothetical protein
VARGNGRVKRSQPRKEILGGVIVTLLAATWSRFNDCALEGQK